MIDLNENLLSAWLQLSTSVVNSRVVSRLAYNESLICHVLYHHQISGNEHPLTATDLCNQTRIVKSLMNRILNQLEAQGLVTKSRLYVHLSADTDTAHKVGARHGKPVIYRVAAQAMAQDGYVFYLSENGVWLTKEVPVKYLQPL